MPVQVPVFRRELMNKMYSPSVYLYARFISSTLIGLFDPIINTLLVFFGLAITNSFNNFMMYLVTCLLLNLIGCAMGYLGGVSFDND